ncbi:MAG: thioredoxin [Bacteroides sp.]|nr:thioredoxin [Bacteroides sp.]MCM1085761.1 thioredoxin [Bacteroides sp.]MCM1168587.1 thioredoxin [Bacteroides sp.]
MKRIILSTLAFFSLALTFSCSAQDKTHVKYLSTADFLEKVHDYKQNPDTWKYKGKLPCLIDFYADWCRPCKMLAPVMEELAAQYEGQVIFYKVNVDVEKELSAAFGIQSIPSLLFVPAEGQPAMNAGVLPKEQLNAYIQSFILGKK